MTIPNRRRLFTLTLALMAILVSARRIAAESADLPSVKLRVDDYAAVATDLLARAQDGVTQLYRSIGVDTRWLKTRHLSSWTAPPPLPVDIDHPDLTVILLDSSMTTRLAPSPDAMGLAARTQSEKGRIAYVFYDRLRKIALQHTASDIAALSLVLAHETGHLLLPYGSHSDAGVMRGHWDREGFRHLDIRQLSFTALQGQQIRRRLGGD